MKGSVPVRASLYTRLVYSFALLALIPSTLASNSGWMSLALGGGMAGGVGLAVLLIVMTLIVFRAYQVLRYAGTLDARPPNILGKFLRYSGWLAMFAGASAGAGLMFVKPITLALFGTAGDAGVGFFAVGLSLIAVSNLGMLGCLVFEVSRACGPRLEPGALVKPWWKRREDYVVLGILLAAATVALHSMQQAVQEPCGKYNLAHCLSNTEGGVRRIIGLPHGEAVALETTLEEIELRSRSGARPWSLVESPAVSLTAAGYPVAKSPEARVRVRLDATAASESVVLTLVVLDGAEETARFVTRFDKTAAIETTPAGGIRVVVELPAHVQPGARSTYEDSSGRRRYKLDQFFVQLRSAIGTEIEAREWPERIIRPAALVEGSGDLRGTNVKAIITQETVAGGCQGMLTRERTTAIAFEGELGWPLHGVAFTNAGSAGPHAIFSHRDRVVCDADGVWILSYGTRRPNLRLRRYASDGRLLRFVDTRLEPMKLGQFETDSIDPNSVREENGRIRFHRVVIKFSGTKTTETKRDLYEIVV